MTSPLPSGASPPLIPMPFVINEGVRSDSSVQNLTNHCAPPLVDLANPITYTSEDKILAYLIAHGIIDADWRLRDPYASLKLLDVVVDSARFARFLEMKIQIVGGKNLLEMKVERFIRLCEWAGRVSCSGVSNFFIHGSFVPYLIGKETFKESLAGLCSQAADLIRKLNLPLSFSDIDLRMDALKEIDKNRPIFFKVLNVAIAFYRIGEDLLFEIHKTREDAKQITAHHFDEFLKILKTEGVESISKIAIYEPLEEMRFYIAADVISAFMDLCYSTQFNRTICINFLHQHYFKEWKELNGTEQFLRRSADGTTVLLDLDTIKLPAEVAPIDFAYRRQAYGSGVRMSHQELSVDLLPFCRDEASVSVYGSLQAVVDLCCGICHWSKEDINKYDFCAYLQMLTQGRRFPDERSEFLLKNCFVNAFLSDPIPPRELLLSFNKLHGRTDDFKVAYLLNAALALNDMPLEPETLFAGFHPQNQALRGIVAAMTHNKVDTPTVMALLQLMAQRLLLLPESERASGLFRVEVTVHKAIPHFKCYFNEAVFFIPIDFRKAWNVLSHTAVPYESLVALVKELGGFRQFTFERDSLLKMYREQLADRIRVDLDSLKSALESANPLLCRVAAFLMLGQLHMFPNETLLAGCIAQARAGRFEKWTSVKELETLFLSCETLIAENERSHYRRAVRGLFKNEIELLFLTCEPLFAVGLSSVTLKIQELDGPLKHHLKLYRTLRALRLVEVYVSAIPGSDDNTNKFVGEIGKQLIGIHTQRSFDAQLYDALNRYGNILTLCLKKDPINLDWMPDREKLVSLFAQQGMKAMVGALTAAYAAEAEAKKQIHIDSLKVAMTQAPTCDVGRDLLKYLDDDRAGIVVFFEEILHSLVKNHPKVFTELLKEVAFRKLLAAPAFEGMLQQLFCILFDAALAIDLTLLDGMIYEELLAKETYLYLLRIAINSEEDLDKACIHFFVEQHIGVKHLQEQLKGEYCLAVAQLEWSKNAKDLKVMESHLYSLLDLCLIVPDKGTSLLIKAYGFLVSILDKSEDPEQFYPLLRMMHSAINPHQLNDQQKSFMREKDLVYLQFFLKHYRHKNASTIGIAYHYIATDLLNQREFNSFKKALLHCVRTYFNNDTPQPFLSLYRALILNLGKRNMYSDLIDGWIQASGDSRLMTILVDALHKYDFIYSSDAPTGKVPAAYLDYIHKRLDAVGNIEDQLHVSALVDLSVIPKKSRTAFRELQRKYFSKYFSLLFDENSPFAQTVSMFWKDMRTCFEPHVFDYDTSVELEQDKNTAILLARLSSQMRSTSDELSGIFIFKELYMLLVTTVCCKRDCNFTAELDAFGMWKLIEKKILDMYPIINETRLLKHSTLLQNKDALLVVMEELKKVNAKEPGTVMAHHVLLVYCFTFASTPDFASHFQEYVFRNVPELDFFERFIYETGLRFCYNYLEKQGFWGLNVPHAKKTSIQLEYEFLFTNRAVPKQYGDSPPVDKALDSLISCIVTRRLQCSPSIIKHIIFHVIHHWAESKPLKALEAFLNLLEVDPAAVRTLKKVDLMLMHVCACFLNILAMTTKVSKIDHRSLFHRMNRLFNEYSSLFEKDGMFIFEMYSKRIDGLITLLNRGVSQEFKKEILLEIEKAGVGLSHHVNASHKRFVNEIKMDLNPEDKSFLFNYYHNQLKKLNPSPDIPGRQCRVDIFPALNDLLVLLTDFINTLDRTQPQIEKVYRSTVMMSFQVLFDWWNAASDQRRGADYFKNLVRLNPLLDFFSSIELDSVESHWRFNLLMNLFVFFPVQLLKNDQLDPVTRIYGHTLSLDFFRVLEVANPVLHHKIMLFINDNGHMLSH